MELGSEKFCDLAVTGSCFHARVSIKAESLILLPSLVDLSLNPPEGVAVEDASTFKR
jgi:hypothetical protein